MGAHFHVRPSGNQSTDAEVLPLGRNAASRAKRDATVEFPSQLTTPSVDGNLLTRYTAQLAASDSMGEL